MTAELETKQHDERFAKFFDSPVLSDCTLVVHPKNEMATTTTIKIQAHKVVLAASSGYFEAAFSSRWSSSDVIDIHDVDMEAFKKLIECIYTDNITNVPPEMLYDVAALASRFQVTKFNKIPEEVLAEGIEPSTALFVLVKSSEWGYHELYLRCLSFCVLQHLNTFVEPYQIGLLEQPHWLDLALFGLPKEHANAYFKQWIELKELSKSDAKQAVEKLNEVYKCYPTRKFTHTEKVILWLDFCRQTTENVAPIWGHKFKVEPKGPVNLVRGTTGCSSYEFGGNNYLQISNSDELNKFLSTFTFEARIFPYGVQNTRIICKATAGTSDCITFDLHPDCSLRIITSSCYYTLPNAVEANKWSHVAVTYGETCALYINGTRLWSITNVQKPRTNSNPLRIGADSEAQNVFRGLMQEIVIHSTELSAEEIVFRAAQWPRGDLPITTRSGLYAM